MPSTSSATAGPSNLLQLSPRQSRSKKREFVEDCADSASSKKIKKESPSVERVSRKKHKRKRVRKMSIVPLLDRSSLAQESTQDASPSMIMPKIKRGKSRTMSRTPPAREDTLEIRSPASESRKGKAPEPRSPLKDRTTPQPGPSQDARALSEVEKQLEEKISLLQMHQTTLENIQQNVTCQICLDLMFKPYVLAPCGHMSCYGCLVSWFNAPIAGEQNPPPALHRRKTCPHCRSVLRERPIEVWGIKSTVGMLAQSGLLKIEAGENAPNDNDPEDPWKNIFPSKSRHHDGDRGPFIDIDALQREFGEVSGPSIGMFDEEDGIHRCLSCAHEILRGECTNCNRQYPDQPDFEDYAHRAVLGPDTIHRIEAIMAMEEDSDEEVYPVFPPPHPHGRLVRVDDYSDSDEDAEEGIDIEEDYEGSFIDDEGVDEEGVDVDEGANEVIEISSDDEDRFDPMHAMLHRVQVGARLHGNVYQHGIDEEIDLDEYEEAMGARDARRRYVEQMWAEEHSNYGDDDASDASEDEFGEVGFNGYGARHHSDSEEELREGSDDDEFY